MTRRRSRNRLPDTQQQTLGLAVEPSNKPAPTVAIEPVATRFAKEQEVCLGNQSVAAYLKTMKQHLPLELRKQLCLQDFSNLCEAQETGRRPIHPRILISLITYGLLQHRTSLRELEQLARLDLGAMYLCGGLQPDHSTIGRFIMKWKEELTTDFFVGVTEKIAKQLGIGLGHAAIDGTIVQAVASSYGTMKLEAAKEHAAELATQAAEAPENKPLQKTAELAAEAAEIGERRAGERERHGKKAETLKVSPTEPEAVLQPLKQGGMAPSYKPSMIADESGLICGQAVDPSSETVVVGELLDQHEKILGGAPKSLSADAGYSNEKTFEIAIARDLNILVPAGREAAKDMKRVSKDGRFVKEDFTYDESTNTYRCPAGSTLVVIERGVDTRARALTKFAASTGVCAACPMKAKCTKAPRRQITRYDFDELKEAMAGILKHPEARKIYAQRKVIIETRNSVLKERQGLRRFRRRGLSGVRVEFALHCLAYNLGFAARRARAAALAVILWLLRLVLAPFGPIRPTGPSGILHPLPLERRLVAPVLGFAGVF